MARIRPAGIRTCERRLGLLCRRVRLQGDAPPLEGYVLRWGPLHLHRSGASREASGFLGHLDFFAAHLDAHDTFLTPLLIWQQVPGERGRVRRLCAVPAPRAPQARLRWIEQASQVVGFLREAGVVRAYVDLARAILRAVPRGRAHDDLRAEQAYESALAALHEGDAERARSGFEKLLRRERDPATRAAILNNLGGALVMLQQDAAAVRVFRRAIQTAERDPEISPRVRLAAMRGLAGASAHLGDARRAIRVLRSMLLGEPDPTQEDAVETLVTRATLASIEAEDALAREDSARVSEAMGEMRDVRDALQRTLGPGHPHSLVAAWNLASTEDDCGHVAEAIAGFEALLPLQERVLGPWHPNTLRTRRALAGCLIDRGRRKRARALLERSLSEGSQSATAEVLATELALGRILLHDSLDEGRRLIERVARRSARAGQLENATDAWLALAMNHATHSEFEATDTAFRAVLRLTWRSTDKSAQEARLQALEGLARVLVVTERPGAAARYFRAALELCTRDPARHIELRRLRAVALRDAGHLRAAHAEFLELSEHLRRCRGPEQDDLHTVLAGLARTLERRGDLRAAAARWREVAQLRTIVEGPRASATRDARTHVKRLEAAISSVRAR